MKSRIIGRIKLDDNQLEYDLETIAGNQHKANESAYSEYVFGSWKNFVLRNPTGNHDDGVFQGVSKSAVPTNLGKKCSYINSVIESEFCTERLMMARVNLMRKGMLIPHRDYVEFKKSGEDLIRLHIPLQMNPESLHSEDDKVFHMRKGEVWILAVDKVHAASNPTDFLRMSLVLDFYLAGDPVSVLFANPDNYKPDMAPMMIARQPMESGFRDVIASLKNVINNENYNDLLMLLSRVHFYKQVDASTCYDWLIEMCKEKEDTVLLERSLKLKRYMIEDREFEERLYATTN